MSFLDSVPRGGRVDVFCSTTPLAADASFDPDVWFDASAWPSFTVSVSADESGTLFIYYSADEGTSVHSTLSLPYVTGDVTVPVPWQNLRGHVKVKYTNGSTLQTAFAIEALVGQQTVPISPLNFTISKTQPSIVTRCFPTNVDKALGKIGGVQSDDKFGYSTGLGTSIQLGTPSTWVDLWAFGGLRTSPTSTFTPYIASSSGSDTGIDILVTYMDSDGYEQFTTVALNGQTPVSCAVTAQEVYRLENVDSTDLAGAVSVATTNSFSSGVPSNQDETLAQIPVQDGRSQVLARRIPVNKKAVINAINVWVSRANGSAGSVDLVFQTRNPGSIWKTLRPYQASTSFPVEDSEISGMVLDPLTDFRLRIRDVSDSSTSVAGVVNFDLVDV